MAGLPLTGLYDTTTREKMTMPRCGVPDYVQPGAQQIKRRQKRFLASGNEQHR